MLVGVHFIHWIVIYPVDKVIQLLNNWGQNYLPICIFKAVHLHCLSQSVLISRSSLMYPTVNEWLVAALGSIE